MPQTENKPKPDYIQYAEGVLDGSIVAGTYIKQAAERFFAMRENPAYVFKAGQVRKVIDFVFCMKHFQDAHAGKQFVLQPWQSFLIAGIYGFYIKETGARLVRNAYVEVARKNGKSALASALSLYHLLMDGVSGAQVYLAANSKQQVKLSSWPLCSRFALSLDEKGKFMQVYRDEVRFAKTNSFLKVLAADSTKLDGPNPSFYLLDEYHAAKSSGLKDVLQSGQGMRANPLGIIITTAGFDLLGTCYEYRGSCLEVLSGAKKNDRLFVAVFAQDEGDDWKDSKNWIKSNPNLGVTIYPDFLEGEITKAINSTSEEVGIKTKNLNIWCSSRETWIPDDYINAASKEKINPADYECCYMGVDLAQTSDLTALAAMFHDKERKNFYFKAWYYLPEAALREKRFADLYGRWKRNGDLILTPGNVTDYEYLLADMIKVRNACPVIKVAYDNYNAPPFVVLAQNEGFNMEAYSQTVGNYNRPTKEIERLIRGGHAFIDNNVINRHGFKNVTLMVDHHGNIKPSKKQTEKKIDGVIAMINSLGAYLNTPQYSNSLY
ncbi:MAG: terminase large subunit [Tannerellaceae bacterium]|jgi:phage terminase large subunit-like protein|nr:terminase large subunit [Tannerellaceae bacterium]